MKRCHILLLAATMIFGSMHAQKSDLSKEITIDKDFVPIEQKASKANALPDVYKADVTDEKSIEYSDWAVPAEVPAMAATLSPYGYLTSRDYATKRGYFEFYIGSYLDMISSAGYRIVDLDDTKLGIWMQHNSTWTGNNTSENTFHAIDQQWNDNNIGIDFAHRFDKGTLTTNAFFHYNNFNYFGRYDENWYALDSVQSINEFRIDIGWMGPFHKDEGFNYSLKTIYNYFGFSEDIFSPVQGNSENHLKVAFNGEYAANEHSRVGLDARFDFLNYTLHEYVVINYDNPGSGDNYSIDSHVNLGIISLNPYYAYQNGHLNTKLGLTADISFNDNTILRLAPDLELGYDFTRGFKFYAQAQGGKTINTLSRMFSMNRYMNPRIVPFNPYTPVDIEGGFKIGPFSGFHATVYGGYAIAKDIQMPFLYNVTTPGDMFDSFNRSISRYKTMDLSGWKVGGEIGYEFGKIAKMNVSATYSPQSEDNGYILGDDRAEFVLDANLLISPIKNLTIGASYELRTNRAVIYSDEVGTAPAITYWYKQDLGNANDLGVSACYRLNDLIGFMLKADNLLNRKWDEHFGMGAQGIAIIGGVSLLF